jgi:integrase
MNPVAGVKSLRDEVDAERDVFTGAQITALLKTAGESDWHGAILGGLTTGLRLGDVVALTGNSLDLEKRTLRIRAQKGRKVMILPLHPVFIEWLKKRTRRIGKAPIFPDLHEKRTGGCNGLSAQFGKLMARADVYGREIRSGEGGGHRTSSLSFHSLRHTFTSMMANAGVHPDVRRKLTGHSDEAVHARYSHHEIETMRAAVDKLAISVEEN